MESTNWIEDMTRKMVFINANRELALRISDAIPRGVFDANEIDIDSILEVADTPEELKDEARWVISGVLESYSFSHSISSTYNTKLDALMSAELPEDVLRIADVLFPQVPQELQDKTRMNAMLTRFIIPVDSVYDPEAMLANVPLPKESEPMQIFTYYCLVMDTCCEEAERRLAEGI